MNFADKLINWRSNEPNIKRSEAYIISLVQKKAKEIFASLEKEAKEEISIKKLNIKSIASDIVTLVNCKYQKDVELQLIYDLLVYTLASYKHVKTFKDEDILLIFYNNAPTITSEVSLKSIECWFNTIILPDFKKQYINHHSNKLTLSHSYSHTYNYIPLVNVVFFTHGLDKDEIKEKIMDLANFNGLTCSIDEDYETFSLSI